MKWCSATSKRKPVLNNVISLTIIVTLCLPMDGICCGKDLPAIDPPTQLANETGTVSPKMKRKFAEGMKAKTFCAGTTTLASSPRR